MSDNRKKNRELLNIPIEQKKTTAPGVTLTQGANFL